MNDHPGQYKIFPISDSALTIDFGNVISETINQKVLSFAGQLKSNPPDGVIESVPAYSSLTVYYNVFQLSKSIPRDQTIFDWLKAQLELRLGQAGELNKVASASIDVPVCYENEFAPDIAELAAKKGISIEEVIRIHTSKPYRVYMLGFLPGFSYMGEVDETIAIPRKPQPKPVAMGSIGIAGRQTGIYPSASPGGWQIIGRTPLKLFDPEKDEPALLKAGDIVKFIPISKHEFESY